MTKVGARAVDVDDREPGRQTFLHRTHDGELLIVRALELDQRRGVQLGQALELT